MSTIRGMYGLSRKSRGFTDHPMIEGVEGVGVEIELEGLSNCRWSDSDWNNIPDGSLRNGGVEFVTRGDGIGGRELFQAITNLNTGLSSFSPDRSWRCSTHVHIDVRDMTPKQVKTLILFYTVYERVFFKCSGWGRFKSNFCVPLGYGQSQVQHLANCWHLEDSRVINQMIRGWAKYTAINLLPISSLGTIEFRMAEPKFHKGQLIKLCNRVLALKKLAMEWEGSDVEFLEFLDRTSPVELFKKGLPRNFQVDNEDLAKGQKLAYEIIYSGQLRQKKRQEALDRLSNGNQTFAVNREYTVLNRFDSSWFMENDLPGELAPFSEVRTLTFEQVRALTERIGANARQLLLPQDYGEYVILRDAVGRDQDQF